MCYISRRMQTCPPPFQVIMPSPLALAGFCLHICVTLNGLMPLNYPCKTLQNCTIISHPKTVKSPAKTNASLQTWSQWKNRLFKRCLIHINTREWRWSWSIFFRLVERSDFSTASLCWSVDYIVCNKQEVWGLYGRLWLYKDFSIHGVGPGGGPPATPTRAHPLHMPVTWVLFKPHKNRKISSRNWSWVRGGNESLCWKASIWREEGGNVWVGRGEPCVLSILYLYGFVPERVWYPQRQHHRTRLWRDELFLNEPYSTKHRPYNRSAITEAKKILPKWVSS